MVKSAHALVPQYTCLLRDHLVKATLRRYLLVLSPAVDGGEMRAAAHAGAELARAAASAVRASYLVLSCQSKCLKRTASVH